ncbi:MAG: glycerophosphodiester phosphodiesterase [Bacteroidales bacterium]|nr:glycerophosphodiester phosphodiesterase [Bacteroidales bacterium]
MKRIITLIAAVAALCSCGTANLASHAPAQVAIVAHRGFWNCEQAGYAQNSVASLKAAQDAGFWGSEFDVQLTKDGVVVSNHDKEYGPEKMVIADYTYEELAKYPLPNGEKLPTLDDYLAQGALSDKTVLVLEFKKQRTDEATIELVDKSMEIVKAHGLYDPSRIVFISFSKVACERVIAEHPQFEIQYLTGDLTSNGLKNKGYTGADYNAMIYTVEPALIANLHAKGLKANVWTVDKPEKMQTLFQNGIDQITTNNPLAARELLGDREYRK